MWGLSQAQWHTPVIPDTQEAEAGGVQLQGQHEHLNSSHRNDVGPLGGDKSQRKAFKNE